MNIRSLVETDYNQILPMLQALHALHVKYRPDVFGATAQALPLEEFHSYLCGEDTYCVISEGEDGVLQGVCLAERRDKNSEDPRWRSRTLVYIKALYVPEDYRKGGIGKALVEEVRTRARQSGISCVELQVVLMPDGAFEFYQSIGFQPQLCSMTYRCDEKCEKEMRQ